MKAYVCREFGPVESHKVEEIADPRAEAGQVVCESFYAPPSSAPKPFASALPTPLL